MNDDFVPYDAGDAQEDAAHLDRIDAARRDALADEFADNPMARSARDWMAHGWKVAIFKKPGGGLIAVPVSNFEWGKLVIGQIDMERGWRCEVVAKPQTVEEALDALQGVEIPA